MWFATGYVGGEYNYFWTIYTLRLSGKYRKPENLMRIGRLY